jgi:urease accessory protein
MVLGNLVADKAGGAPRSGPAGSIADDTLLEFVDASIVHTGRAALPFVTAACDEPRRLAELDASCDAMLCLQSPNRASRAQGRAFASAASHVWEEEPVAVICEYARHGPAHHAPVFGAICGALGASTRDAAAGFLHGAARNILSAAVRLGLAGPLEAQRLLATRAGLLDHVARSAESRGPSDAAQTMPLVEIYAGLHDRLDGRMFQS